MSTQSSGKSRSAAAAVPLVFDINFRSNMFVAAIDNKSEQTVETVDIVGRTPGFWISPQKHLKTKIAVRLI